MRMTLCHRLKRQTHECIPELRPSIWRHAFKVKHLFPGYSYYNKFDGAYNHLGPSFCSILKHLLLFTVKLDMWVAGP